VSEYDDPTVHRSPTSALLAVLAEPTRLRILSCVVAAPLFVSDLMAILGLPQPTVSRPLRVLREQGLVIDLAMPERAAALDRSRASFRSHVAGVEADVT